MSTTEIENIIRERDELIVRLDLLDDYLGDLVADGLVEPEEIHGDADPGF